MSEKAVENVFLGVAVGENAVHVTSSLGQRSAITSERLRSPEDWIELATYGIQLPERRELLACVAVPSGYPREKGDEIIRAARAAGWDGVLLVSSLHAAGRAIRAQTTSQRGDLAMVVVDPAISSVGILRDEPLGIRSDDHVHPIAGREAREVAVSLRCLLKLRPRDDLRRLLRRVVIAGDMQEVDRIGRRQFVRELEGLGVKQVEFDLDPFLIACGAELLAAETERQTWRRIRRRWRNSNG